MEPKRKDNIVRLGHNSDRSISQEQYAKVVKGYHHMMRVVRHELRRAVRNLDEAFTKYPNSNSNNRKLKDFEIHESRARGKKIADKVDEVAWGKICKLEEIAKENGIEVPFQNTEADDE